MDNVLNILRNLTVRMEYGGFMWTGSIIGSRSNPPQTIILSCAHALQNDMNQHRVSNAGVKVFFYDSNISYNASVVLYEPPSDLLVVIVHHQHTHFTLPFFDVRQQPFMAMRQSVYCVGHAPSVNWIYHNGCIATRLFANNLNPRLNNNLELFGHNTGTPRGSSGGAIINDAGQIVGIQLMAHANTFNLFSTNVAPAPPPADANPEDAEAYQAYMEGRSFVTLHGINFEICKDVLMPLSNLSFASSINYLDAKIRELIPNHNNLPLNVVIANYVFGM